MAATPSPEAASRSDNSAWQGFRPGLWQKEINVRDFIQQNYTPYDGDGTFLKGATARTRRIWDRLQALFIEERRKGVLDVSQIPGSITALQSSQAGSRRSYRPRLYLAVVVAGRPHQAHPCSLIAPPLTAGRAVALRSARRSSAPKSWRTASDDNRR